MPPRATESPTFGQGDRYWQRRIRSPGFRRDLTALITRELRALARERSSALLDPELIRARIREWDGTLLNEHIVAAVLVAGNRQTAARLKRHRGSLRDTLDARVVSDLEAFLPADIRLSRPAEEFIAHLMQQEFVRRLFTDIIFTSLLAFQERVNPLFGGITTRLWETQIKAFLERFMPMLQSQATAFAVSPQNQRVLLGFLRAIVGHMLDQPLSNYVRMAARRRNRADDALLRKVVADAAADAKLKALVRDMALAFWNGLYKTIADKKLGDLIRLEEHAGWLAARLIDTLLPVLSRPGVMQFIAAESTRAAAAVSREPPPR